jgi:hypothetical protein
VPDEPTADAQVAVDQLVRRLRGLSPRARGVRRDNVLSLLAELVVIGGDGHPLPDVPEHAWADAVAVLGHDALAVAGRADDVARLVRAALASAS